MTAIVVVDQDNESLFFAATVAISPTGGWRAAVQQRSDTSAWVFYRSSNGGATWTAITAPTTPASTGTDADFLVAVDDSGNLYAIAGTDVAQDCVFWKYSSGAWGTGVTLASGSGARIPQWIGTDGTNVVALYADNSGGGTSLVYSTNGGTTWTFGGSYSSDNAASDTVTGVWLGSYVHFTNMNYKRWDVTGHAFSTIATAPGVATNASFWNNPVVLSRHTSTSELWLIQPHLSPTTTLQIFKSTDSGLNWSTITTTDNIPSALGTWARQGVSMGSDDKLHFWGQGDGTAVLEMARDLSGTWDTAASSVAVAGYSALAHTAQRKDGTQPNDAEIWMQLRQASGTATPTVLTLITGVTGPGGWSVGTIKIGG